MKVYCKKTRTGCSTIPLVLTHAALVLCCLLLPLQAGIYSFTLLPPAGCAASLGQTLRVQVFPGAADASKSFLSVAAPAVPVVGSRVNVNISLRDVFGNSITDPCDDPDSQVWLELRGGWFAVL